MQAASVNDLESSLSSVRGGLSELDGSLDKYASALVDEYGRPYRVIH